MATDKYKGFDSKAKYNTFVRGNLRRMWLKWPLRFEFLKERRQKLPIGKNGREVWGYVCEYCKESFRPQNIDVDHIEEAGSLDDLNEFINNLLCDKSNMRILCKECHKAITLANKKDISIEEAKAERKANQFARLSKEKQIKILKKWNMHEVVTTAKARKELAKTLFLAQEASKKFSQS